MTTNEIYSFRLWRGLWQLQLGSGQPRAAVVLSNTRHSALAVNEARLNYTRNAGISGEPTDPTVPLSSLGL